MGLEKEQAELLSAVESAPAREHEARVRSLEVTPGRRSDAKGAASPVRKIREQFGRDGARLGNISLELVAARAVLAKWDAADAASVHADRDRLAQEQAVRDGEIIAARKAEGLATPAPAPEGAVTAIRRGDPRWRGASRSGVAA